MRISLGPTVILAVLIGFIVSPSRANTICPQPSSPDGVSDITIPLHNFTSNTDVVSVVGSEVSFREIATGEIHVLPEDLPGIDDHRSSAGSTDLRPTLHVMPKREFFSDTGGGPVQAPEPQSMLLLASGLTALFLVRWRITPK
jgi:hypothetical protein